MAWERGYCIIIGEARMFIEVYIKYIEIYFRFSNPSLPLWFDNEALIKFVNVCLVADFL